MGDTESGPADPQDGTSELLERYTTATRRWESAEREVHAAADARALAVAELCESGLTMRTVAGMLGMTAARVHKLTERGRVVRGAAEPADQQENSTVAALF